ncbi:cytochrome P450 [Mycobacterium spongiae]|uniref:cytochrome P450 n=1 Tax=Mycobacterium spongiae TaxID=886343 RepID=UPI001FE2E6AD|nr:cytochrome P450 [Mycobacterium spongiae]
MTTTLQPLDIDGIDFASDDRPDLHEVLAKLRSQRDYAIVPFAGTRAVLLLTQELVAAGFRDEETFPSWAAYTMATKPVLGHTIQCMSGREHRVNRAIVSTPLRRNHVAQYLEPIIEPAINELIDRFAHRGEADLVAEFTQRFSLLINNRMLGIPVEDEQRFYRWAQGLIHYPWDPEEAKRCARELTEYVMPIIAARRIEPGDDMISRIVSATTEDGEQLDDEQVLSFVRLLYPVGADTTMLAMGIALAALFTHPEQLDLLRSDPDEHLEWAVWEALRWEPPVALLPRACPEAVTWHGIDIPAQTPMVFAITAANRDPSVYPNPDHFDITRRVTPMVAFGQGPHSCIGNWLAFAELVAALRTLLTRLPNLRVAPGAAGAVRVTSQVGTALRGVDTLPVRFDPA